jgi:hypothetical protein
MQGSAARILRTARLTRLRPAGWPVDVPDTASTISRQPSWSKMKQRCACASIAKKRYPQATPR